MGVNEIQNFSSKFSLEIFQETFEKIEPELLINSFEEEKGSDKGDNYTATLYRILLKGSHKNSNDEKQEKWEKSVICKRLPDNVARREAYKSVLLFRNEVEFYTSILPELLKFQKSKTNRNIFKAIPQCYSARNDLLILEDLRRRGFKMANRQNGLSIDETKSVLKEVAKLHSLSLAYKIHNPKQFEKLKNLITEGIFCSINEDWYKKYYGQLTKNAINMVSDVLPKNSKYLKTLIDFTDNSEFFSHMIHLVTKESRLSVICHGDCWTNNFMYRYDENGKVIETIIVDYQLIRYGSPSLDISSLIYCCTSKSIRDENLTSFINFYIKEFYGSLQIMIPNELPEYFNTESKFKEIFLSELKEYGKFALGIALDIIPISTCSPEDAPDLYSCRQSDKPDGAPLLNFPPNDLCRQKMSEILIDLVDGGML